MSCVKYILISLFLFLSNLGFSQSYQSDFSKRFSFGVSFSPDYTYRTLKSNVDELDFIDIRNESESARFGFTTGLSVKYLLSERWVLESGLQYADRGDKMETEDTGYVFPEDGSDPVIPDKTESINHYYFLGVPLKVNFYLLNKRCNVFLSGGVSTDFFSGSNTKQIHTIDGEKQISSYSEEGVDFNTINFVGLAGFGIDYRINEKLELRFEPMLRYSFSSLTSYSDLHTYLYSYGLNFAIYFQK